MENEINKILNINAESFVPRNINSNPSFLMNHNRNSTDVGINVNSNNVANTANSANTNPNTNNNSNNSVGVNLDPFSSSSINFHSQNRQDVYYHPSTLSAGTTQTNNSNPDFYSQFSNMMISPSGPASPYDVSQTHQQQQAALNHFYLQMTPLPQQPSNPHNLMQILHQQQQQTQFQQNRSRATNSSSNTPFLSNRAYGHTSPNMNLPHHTLGRPGISGSSNLSNISGITNPAHHHQSVQPFHQLSGAMAGGSTAGGAGAVIPSPADRARRNSCVTIKTFNTGNEEINRRLTSLYKEVNPRSEFSMDLRNTRFFVIKSYTEDHVHRSIKYGEWCSTQKGNEVLDNAYRSVTTPNAGMANNSSYKPGTVLLFFSVNGSGYFCGVAEMTSRFDPTRRGAHWTNDSLLPGGGSRWSGGFDVRWRYVKDVPNKYLKHIILECNDNRPVTNSRDATEIRPKEKGIETLRIIHEYHNNSSLFDDFDYYETREQQHNSTTTAALGMPDVIGSMSHR